MKKIISILACVCLLLSAMVIPVSAAETTATITFDDPSKAQWSSEQQLWQENGITVTNNKADSTTAIDTSKKYSNPARFYKNSEVTIEYPGMTKIEIDVVGVPVKKKYKLILNSDDKRFGGNGGAIPTELTAQKGECDGRPYYLEFNLPAYGAALFVF